MNLLPILLLLTGTGILLSGLFIINNQNSLSEVKIAYEAWKTIHRPNLSISNAEDSYRFSIFLQSYNKIKAHSSTPSNYELGLTKFADISDQEFKAQFLKFQLPKENQTPKVLSKPNPLEKLYDTPESKDWVAEGAVRPPLNQGNCGSCWAFASCAVLESFAYIKGNKDVPYLSPQYLMDCVDPAYGMKGCDGGSFSALYWTEDVGMLSLNEYPYKEEVEKCRKEEFSDFLMINRGTYMLKGQDLIQLKDTLARQPVAVGIAADPLRLYTKGIYDNTQECNNYGLNHAVVLVGYGVENGEKFWKVKNSWGADWGEDGFFRLGAEQQPGEIEGHGNTTCHVGVYSVIPTD